MLIKTYAFTTTPLLRINYKPTGGAILSFRMSRFNAFYSYLSNLIQWKLPTYESLKFET